MTTTPAQLELLCLRAASEPIGLLLRASDPGRARNALYAAAKRRGLKLQIRMSPFSDGDLLLLNDRIEVRRSQGDGE